MATCYVALSASDTWYGRIIRKLTNSDVNHSFIVYRDELWGGEMTIDITEEGVVVLPYSKHKIVEFWECATDLTPAFSAMKWHLGREYDWTAILGFAGKALAWKLFHRKTDNEFDSTGRDFCSEFVVLFLQHAKGPGADGLIAHETSPGDLKRYFLAHPDLFKRIAV